MPSSEGMKPSPADAAERSGFGHSISAVGDRRDLFGSDVAIISHDAQGRSPNREFSHGFRVDGPQTS